MGIDGLGPRLTTLTGLVAAALVLVAWAPPASAQEQKLRIELNKLEPIEADCRAYLLFENQTSLNFQSMKLDLVMFNPDGVINKRLAVEGAPLPPAKTSVKLFDIEGVACEVIDRMLLNGVLACADAEGERSGCLDLIDTSSRAGASFFK